jgi:prevent-host-death family protein
MKKYPAGEFKAKCLKILDDVVREQEAVYVTKRGKLVAAVVPPPAETEDLVAGLEGSIVFEEDILAPIDADWDAEP